MTPYDGAERKGREAFANGKTSVVVVADGEYAAPHAAISGRG